MKKTAISIGIITVVTGTTAIACVSTFNNKSNNAKLLDSERALESRSIKVKNEIEYMKHNNNNGSNIKAEEISKEIIKQDSKIIELKRLSIIENIHNKNNINFINAENLDKKIFSTLEINFFKSNDFKQLIQNEDYMNTLKVNGSFKKQGTINANTKTISDMYMTSYSYFGHPKVWVTTHWYWFGYWRLNLNDDAVDLIKGLVKSGSTATEIINAIPGLQEVGLVVTIALAGMSLALSSSNGHGMYFRFYGNIPLGWHAW